MNRLEVRAQILTCSNCQLSQRCTAPVPFDGPTPAKLAVIGEAPGKQEDSEGKPFVGPAGSFLKEVLVNAGVRLEETVFFNAASCFPVDFQGKGRAPNDVELKACRDNLMAQLELGGATFILVTGGVPLKAIRPGLKISVVRGVPFLLSTPTHPTERLVLPTFHPSYVLRKGGKGSEAHRLMEEDLRLLQRLTEAPEEDWVKYFPEVCLLCDEYAERFTDDGLGYCSVHWKGAL